MQLFNLKMTIFNTPKASFVLSFILSQLYLTIPYFCSPSVYQSIVPIPFPTACLSEMLSAETVNKA